MEKKVKAIQQTAFPRLWKETLQWLDDFKIQGVFGGARMWRPSFFDDTTPISDDTIGQ
jgi:hypothetical protein